MLIALACLLLIGAAKAHPRRRHPTWADLVEALGERMAVITRFESDPTRLAFTFEGRDRQTNARVRATMRYGDVYLFGEMDSRLRALAEATSRAQREHAEARAADEWRPSIDPMVAAEVDAAQRRRWREIGERASQMGLDEANAYLSVADLPPEGAAAAMESFIGEAATPQRVAALDALARRVPPTDADRYGDRYGDRVPTGQNDGQVG